MSLIPKDMTPVYKATIAKGTSGTRWQRPVYVDYLPPCNNTCPPARTSRRGWASLRRAGTRRRGTSTWRTTRCRARTAAPATTLARASCNRKYLDQPVSIHSLDRFLGDLAIEERLEDSRSGRRRASECWSSAPVPAACRAPITCGAWATSVEIRDAGAAPGGMMRYGIPAYRLPREGLTQEIDRILAMGVNVICNYRVDDVLGGERAPAASTRCSSPSARRSANHLDIPSMDGGKMIHALSLLEQIEMGQAPKLGRVVGIVGGGNTAVDVARVAKRLGAEEAVMIYRSDRKHMKAHPSEAMEAFAEGVKIRWMSTVKQFGSEEITVEEMEMAARRLRQHRHRQVRAAEDRFAGARGGRARGPRIPEDAARRSGSAAATSSRWTTR